MGDGTYMSCCGSLAQGRLVQSFEVFVLEFELTVARVLPLRGNCKIKGGKRETWTQSLLHQGHRRLQRKAEMLENSRLVRLTLASVFWIANHSIAERVRTSGQFSSRGLRLADVVFHKQHVLLVRVQSFHFGMKY